MRLATTARRTAAVALLGAALGCGGPQSRGDTGAPRHSFNMGAARTALIAAVDRAGRECGGGALEGRGRVVVTYERDGSPTVQRVQPAFRNATDEACVEAAFRAATVPPFDGDSLTVIKHFAFGSGAPAGDGGGAKP